MSSKRSHEGYFLLDHSQGPGLPELVTHQAGLPPGAGQGVFESATFTCSHCQVVVVLNPNRSRERGYCRRCDHYVCDACETKRVAEGGACLPYKVFAAILIDEAIRKSTVTDVLPAPSLIVPP